VKLVKFILMLLPLDMITLRILLQMFVVSKVKLDLRLRVTPEFWATGTTRTATQLKQYLYVLLCQRSFKKVVSYLANGVGLEGIL